MSQQCCKSTQLPPTDASEPNTFKPVLHFQIIVLSGKYMNKNLRNFTTL